MRKYTKGIYISLLALSISSCGTSDSDPEPTILEGTWSTGCSGPDEDGEYSIEIDTYTGDKLTFTETIYGEDSTCTTESLIIDSTSTITLSDSYILGSGETVYDLNLSNATFTLTPKSLGTVTELNSSSFCGHTSWEINVGKSMIGCDLDDDTISDIEADMFGIVEFNTTSIRYGIDVSTTIENRVTSLEQIITFTKQ